MKAKLIKNHYGYAYLLADENGNTIATSDNSRLSLKNCDSLFGVVDVDGMMKDILSNCSKTKEGYILGFKMAMALNKDKLFTLNDMRKGIQFGEDNTDMDSFDTVISDKEVNEFIQSLQQPTEIEVEVVMECPQCQEWGYVSECRKDCNKKFLQPKLDSEGCLILKHVV